MSIKCLGIIGAMASEVASLKKLVSEKKIGRKAGMEFCAGRIGDMSAVIVQSGIGKVNAALCAQILIDDFQVAGIINTGVAGALDKRLDIGDIVVSLDAVQHDYDVSPIGFKKGEIPYTKLVAFPAAEKLRIKAEEAVKKVLGRDQAIVGRICSGDQFISSREKKQQIVTEFGGLCAEMEGAAIAQACYLNGVPFVIIRAISDKADESGGISFEQFEKEAAKTSAEIVKYMVGALSPEDLA